VSSLSVVIPIRDEPEWIGVAVRDLVTAVQQAGLDDVELVIVDDGSQQPTRDALAALETPFPRRVIRQPPSGRFAARRAGIEAARHERVLLLDSRVSIRPDALAFVRDRPGVWNAHVDVDVDGQPYARFWNVLTELAFHHYFGDPRTTSYGAEDFDRFPKGTTCFLAPRDELLATMGSVRSLYDDLAHANDDTLMIRELVADGGRINISPGFSCLYRSRTSLRGFLRHAYHRGGVFVDGYGRRGTRFFPVVAAFFPASLAGLAVLRRRPALALLAPNAAAAAALALRRSHEDARVMGTLGPLWLAAYAAGMWRGLVRALSAAARR